MTAPEYPSATILPSTSTTTTTNININNITTPTYTPSLLTATPSKGHIHLIIGCNALASARCTRSLEVGALPTVIFPETLDSEEVHLGLKKRIEDGEVGFVNRVFEVMDLKTLGREEVEHFVDAVFVTAGYGGGGVDGITTSGMGCKLASRLRRTVASALPAGIGGACERWLSQICEYWPLQKLVDLTEEDINNLFDEYSTSTSTPLSTSSTQQTETEKPKGTISLIGSGPGNPSLLTKASLDALLSADLILADKLVPSQILSLVPRRSTLFIARKFPGNAEAAQLELLEKGLEAIQRGQKVVRLKQGDPYIYGRGAEEYQWFEKMGVKIEVLPGITSALSAPLYAAIPSTHRAVADQILICTGTGRKGVPPDPPVYVKSQTTVFLMACHRLASLVDGLVKTKGWPEEVPCAVIERASCEDQRVVRSTLKNIVAAIEEVGSRPPGLFVVGWACEVLKKVDGAWSVEEGL
ncbi:hypothetical protein TWF788_000471 [Orbilia oligospora]|uniref:uroporphyrinogen-III C-methyltransferase n=1 Tax=Orbilia oligospora TaxID=2813651 RepID=A0A7C8U2M3_ORBOL|nr:hypothetical protein TWF788_000471 [Orbilia oligospora]